MTLVRTRIRPKFVGYHKGAGKEYVTQLWVRNVSKEVATFNLWVVLHNRHKKRKKNTLIPYAVDYQIRPGDILTFWIDSIALAKRDSLRMKSSKKNALVITVAGIA